MTLRKAAANAARNEASTNTARAFCQAATAALALIYGLILCYLVAVAITPMLNTKHLIMP